MRFIFLDPGPLIDNELQLVAPDPRWIDDLLFAAHHPLTVRDAPRDSQTTQQKLSEFLSSAPQGPQPAAPAIGRLPAYHFWMKLSQPLGDPPIAIAGGIGLRIGTTPEIELYTGNVGYHV